MAALGSIARIALPIPGMGRLHAAVRTPAFAAETGWQWQTEQARRGPNGIPDISSGLDGSGHRGKGHRIPRGGLPPRSTRQLPRFSRMESRYGAGTVHT